jgi:N-acetylglucosaminyldiphosphoundecaprenol N-acetyl-beta-D-mannosaminyltransferase
MNRVNICNIPVDAMSMQQSLDLIETAICHKQLLHHVVVNAAKIVNAQKDLVLRASIISCDLINADGQAVVWASRFLNKRLPERVAGIDLMEMLVKRSSEKGYKIFLLGAKEDVVQKVVSKYISMYGTDIIAGFKNGYFNIEEEEKVATQIADSHADILFVAMSSPRKEIFLNQYKDLIKTPFIMGVGGSFDVISGLVKRAPVWMQKLGFEWFYRFWQEPGRMWKRYLFGNSRFIYLVIKQKLTQILKLSV